jgi:hypothetical protein
MFRSVNPKLIQGSLYFLTLVSGAVGIWALLFPLSFYQAFPGFGHSWVSVDGPYNEHLVRDFGGLNLGIAVLCILAARRSGWVSPFVVGLVTLTFNLPHLLYHLHHLDLYAPIDQVGNVVSLVVTLGASLLLVASKWGQRN